MNSTQTKQQLEQALRAFATGRLKDNALHLFATLGYESDKRLDLTPNTAPNFIETFDLGGRLDPERAMLDQWRAVEFLFQLTADEIAQSARLGLFTTDQVDNTIIQSYLFIALELAQPERPYTRTQLARITREINKQFSMPVLLLFKHDAALTFAVINRRLHKRDPGKDVLEKVTLIKDIQFANPHRAHVEILYDLSLSQLHAKYEFRNFVELHRAWGNTLDSSELNKRFFQEVANWYFWAVETVTFPQDADPDPDVRNATSVIRLITRLIFVWFIKEKGLVPADLFIKRKVEDLLTHTGSNESSYYKAVLQNLFFATLNQEMNTPAKPDNRKFRHRAKERGQRDQHYMIHNLYRYEDYFKDPAAALGLFSTIPFLNGGLFECLDKKDPADPGRILRIDGFSDHPKNELAVPNYLFFSEERAVDLNRVYDTRGKKYKVRGLIDILDSYKFTIDENTPIEEEIALDPELLGKVFENLLAAYNPETETTARKQTGSFYTPREIVNYMVDESLIAYLESQLKTSKVLETFEVSDVEARLRHLFAYNEEPHQFSQAEVTKLIRAIDSIKILDPACGSGAFPMGILHKLVFILSKLDWHNERWKERQIEKAAQIPDSTIREKVIQDIEEAFERNELDYGRKLYLIENCIYGVDIQPIAVQIAKLRFFISLVVDQKIDDGQENRGVRPLPNLETKFVAANTLIDVEKPLQMTLRDPAIDQKEAELAEIRRSHFTARTPKTKEKYRQLDEQIRAEIGELLKRDGFSPDTTNKLAQWNPYDQNASADFYDPEWMFGIADGFDIVIGNPPYARVQTLQQTQPERVEYYKQHYISAKGSFDIYVVFIEKGFDLLSAEGVFSYIVPHKFFQSRFGVPIRELLAKRKAILQIVRFGAQQVFDEATTYTCLLFLSRRQKDKFQLSEVKSLENPAEVLTAIQTRAPHTDYEKDVVQAPNDDNWTFYVGGVGSILQKLYAQSHTLEEIIRKIFQGIATSADKIYVLETLEFKENTVRCYSRALDGEVEIDRGLVKPFLMGKDVHRYEPLYPQNVVVFPYLIQNGIAKLMTQDFIRENFPLGWQYLVDNKIALSERERGRMYGKNFYAYIYPKNLTEFEAIKVMTPDICRGPQMTIDETASLYHTTTLYSFVFRERVKDSPKYFLGILNSKILWFFLRHTGTVLRGGYLRFKTEYLKPFPIPCSLSKTPPTESQHDQIVSLVNQILAAKQAPSGPPADTSVLEAEIDQLVYQLYGLTAEEIAIVEEVTNK